MTKALLRPGDVFVHESIEAVVEVAARQLQPQQWFEQVRPGQVRGERDVAGLAVESDDGLNIGHHITLLFLRYAQLVYRGKTNQEAFVVLE